MSEEPTTDIHAAIQAKIVRVIMRAMGTTFIGIKIISDERCGDPTIPLRLRNFTLRKMQNKFLWYRDIESLATGIKLDATAGD
ncbi:hypothetical protein A6D87_10535 [Klebsiella quasipneumoniae]|nr:hypothetical protein A6D87_10535 [Klebsiella quasipneumoniae]